MKGIRALAVGPVALLFFVPSFAVAAEAGAAVICRNTDSPLVEFAAEEIKTALGANGFAVSLLVPDAAPAGGDPRVILELKPDSGIAAQGYAIRAGPGKAWRVTGSDEAGVMYGGLQVAEDVRLGKGLAGVRDADGRPAIARRGLKFNIPLDARTPSFDDSGDSAQTNIAEMWNFDFWREFLDDMACHRYNVLSLWNPHPFPSMVRLPDYPDVALDGVCVTTLPVTSKAGSIGDHMGVSDSVLKNRKVVRKISMDEKIAFWRRVMKYAKDRGIETYFITWNVLVNSAAGKYGLSDAQDNPKTIAYIRQCVREFILTYPDLTGIGVTAGERMQDRQDEFAKEKWLWSAYGLGVLDAKAKAPGRTVRFIHRVWQTDVDKLMEDFGTKYPDPFELSFKYAHARLYSSPTPVFADDLAKDLRRYGLRCWWNLRNDDIFCFRWGDPDYVRAFFAHFPTNVTAGYYMGSDGYVWARECIALAPETPRALEIRKHWFSFLLWGRLGYDPTLDRAFFEKVLADRFPGAPAPALYDAWTRASKVIPLVNRFHWCDWDYQWSVEGCVRQGGGFHTVRDFLKAGTMPDQGLVSITDFVEKGKTDGQTPPQVAAELQDHAAATIRLVEEIRRKAPDAGKELRETLGDLEAMAHLGNYYASKILGAVELARFDRSKNEKDRTAAVRHLEAAVGHWRKYAETATRQYRPQLLARTGRLDWTALLENVRADVDLARSAP